VMQGLPMMSRWVLSCLILPNAKITGVYHYTLLRCLAFFFFLMHWVTGIGRC
jgi:hypothetical protein